MDWIVHAVVALEGVVNIAVATCGVSLVRLALIGYRLDLARGNRPLWWFHGLNLFVGLLALAWAAHDLWRSSLR